MPSVSIIRTSPKTVLDDYGTLMRSAGYEHSIPRDKKTILKINLSWSLFYPACSTPPWQLDGVLATLCGDGYQDVLCAENQTVVTHPWKGAYNNKWLPVLRRYDVEYQPLTNVKWVPFSPKAEMLVMHELFPEILIPEPFIGSNIVHLPTLKTHGHTITTGAMKNAFGGLIPKYRHHAHRLIHEVLVDLLTIQQEIHAGIFAVMDGTVCGDGAGPRTMVPYIGNIILASDDQVAIDAVAAKVMGFDPLSIDYIRIAHDRGLGNGDLDQIEIIGMDRREFERLDFGFTVKQSPVIRWDQRLRKGTANIPWLHHLLFHSPFFRIFILASEVYHDRLWYPWKGMKYIREFQQTRVGALLRSMEYGEYPAIYER